MQQSAHSLVHVTQHTRGEKNLGSTPTRIEGRFRHARQTCCLGGASLKKGRLTTAGLGGDRPSYHMGRVQESGAEARLAEACPDRPRLPVSPASNGGDAGRNRPFTANGGATMPFLTCDGRLATAAPLGCTVYPIRHWTTHLAPDSTGPQASCNMHHGARQSLALPLLLILDCCFLAPWASRVRLAAQIRAAAHVLSVGCIHRTPVVTRHPILDRPWRYSVPRMASARTHHRLSLPLSKQTIASRAPD